MLLVIVAAAGVMGFAVVARFRDNMSRTPRIMTGERVFPMPAGAVPRGGAPVIPREAREVATRRPNPVAATPESVTLGRHHYQTFCTPCHGPEGRGDGPVSAAFIPPPDLTSPTFQRARTDGYWESYVGVGGVVMPAYGDALSAVERWHVVNFLRTLAAQ